MKPRFAYSIVFLLFSLIQPPCLCGQFTNDFESSNSSWRRSESDCLIKRGSWKQTRMESNSSNSRFERAEFFVSGQGTRTFLTHDVPPALVISELQPSVFVRAPQAGVRLYVRVVLPQTPSPKGDGPMTCLLRGPVYRNAGRWEKLSFSKSGIDIAELLQEELWVLSNRHRGIEISRQGAYVDKLAINAYQGPGPNRIDFDDLRLDGRVAAKAFDAAEEIVRDPNFSLASAQEEQTKPKALVTRKGTMLLAKGKPFFPKNYRSQRRKVRFFGSVGVQRHPAASDCQLRTTKASQPIEHLAGLSSSGIGWT